MFRIYYTIMFYFMADYIITFSIAMLYFYSAILVVILHFIM